MRELGWLAEVVAFGCMTACASSHTVGSQVDAGPTLDTGPELDAGPELDDSGPVCGSQTCAVGQQCSGLACGGMWIGCVDADVDCNTAGPRSCPAVLTSCDNVSGVH